MCFVEGGDGAGLDEIVVDADESTDVATGHVVHLPDAVAHHGHRVGHLLHGQTLAAGLAGLVLGRHDAHRLARAHRAREEAPEGREARAVVRRDHLAHVHHHRRVRVTVLHACKCDIELFT